jgi:hypothetical protein
MSNSGIPEKTGIMVCGHGSRNQNAAREFATVAEGLKARYPDAGGIRLSRILQSGDLGRARPACAPRA